LIGIGNVKVKKHRSGSRHQALTCGTLDGFKEARIRDLEVHTRLGTIQLAASIRQRVVSIAPNRAYITRLVLL